MREGDTPTVRTGPKRCCDELRQSRNSSCKSRLQAAPQRAWSPDRLWWNLINHDLVISLVAWEVGPSSGHQMRAWPPRLLKGLRSYISHTSLSNFDYNIRVVTYLCYSAFDRFFIWVVWKLEKKKACLLRSATNSARYILPADQGVFQKKKKKADQGMDSHSSCSLCDWEKYREKITCKMTLVQEWFFWTPVLVDFRQTVSGAIWKNLATDAGLSFT